MPALSMLNMKVLIAIVVAVLVVIGVAAYYFLYIAPSQPSGGEQPTGEVASPSASEIGHYIGKRVKFSGKVADIPFTTKIDDTEYVKLVVSGEGGNVYVYVVQSKYTSQPALPGDQVSVEGEVKKVSGAPSIIIGEGNKYSVTKLSGTPSKVTSVSKDMKYKLVEVEGKVSLIEALDFYTRLTIKVGETEIKVLVPSILSDLGQDLSGLTDLYGHSVTVKGVVIVKGTSIVIIVRNMDDIIDHGLVQEAITKISEFANKIGEEVTVYAIFGPITYDRGKYYVTIIDDTGIAKAVFDSTTFRALVDPFTIGTGSNVSITGTVTAASLLEATSLQPVDPRPSPLLDIATVNDKINEIEGYTVVVRGTITSLTNRSTYAILNIADDTGSIKVFIPGSTRDELEHMELLSEGTEVVIAGYTAIFKGSPEIVVFTSNGLQPSDYSVPGEGLGIPELPTPGQPSGEYKTISVSDIAMEQIGSRVIVENVVYEKIVDYSSSDDSYVIEIRDDTGYGYVYIASSLFEQLFDPWSVGNGTILNVKGYVDSKTVAQQAINVIVAENVTLLTVEPPIELHTGEATEALIGLPAVIRGATITSSYTPSYMKLSIDDGTGALTVYIPSSVASKISSDIKALLTEGREIDVAGYIDQYRGEMEIIVYTPSGIKIAEEVSATPITLSQLGSTEVGTVVTVTVVLDNVTYQNHQYYIGVHDNTGSAYILVSRDLLVSSIDPWTVGCGSQLEINGTVTSDEAFGTIITAASISIVNAVEPPVPRISNITVDDEGAIVRLYNVTIVDYYESSSFAKLVVNDGTGNITVFIPISVLGSLPSEVKQALNTGNVVSIAGYVEIYQGQLEIVIYTPSGIRL